MNLAQYVHTRWAADGTLNGLLPVASVSTGRYFAADPGSRFATITLPGGSYDSRHNDGSAVNRTTVRIQVHHDNYDLGLAIANAVLSAFNRSEFALSGTDRTINMQATGPPMELQNDETAEWDFVIDFDCLVHLATGV